ncbi:DUF4390 domain-containing protein [Sulfuricystis multivorans]|uniref:DUF4390 domain-containing protein n=1 Tax=Sulfuricystis multivorans TaxID=2211108 RepID=UPI000F8232E2|nr:DUF4390 domain-containing protein [Sulfuricystis multivorans]
MTASITPCWKKCLERLVALGVGLFVAWLAWAGSIQPQSAAVVPDERGWAVNAEFDVEIGARLIDAVGKGVPLHFRFEVQIKRKRWYWIDEHLAGRVVNYRLSYHALTRQYRLAVGSLYQNFATLEAALAALGHIRRLHIADAGALPQGETLIAAVRLSLDQSQLPKPLQIDALANDDWRVDAHTLSWQFVPAAEPQ